MTAQRRDVLLKLAAAAGAALGCWLLYRVLGRYSFEAIGDALASIPAANILRCAAFTLASYFCLSLGDWLALRYAGHPLSYRRAALASFVALSIGHSIGFAGLSSGAIRYRFYRRWGLSVGDVARLVLFCGMTVATGLFTLAALVLLLAPQEAAAPLGIGIAAAQAGGVLLAMPVLAYIGFSFAGERRLTIRRWHMAMPRPHLALAQAMLGTVNFACVAAALHAAVSAGAAVAYPRVLGAFVAGNGLALVTHVPGGLGVIETVVLALVPEGAGFLIGALVLFRATYYLAPLLAGLTAFAVSELVLRRSGGARRRQQRTGTE